MHVSYRHSWDLLAVNFAKVIFWFNPLIYLFEKSLREVHEYQADQGVTTHFAPKEYATLLLRLITAKPGWQFMNNFNQFQTKKRIIMMAKGKSSAVHKLRFLALIPVVGLLLFMFACEKEEVLPAVTELEKEFPQIMEVPLTQEAEPELPKEEILKVNPLLITEVADEVFDVVEQQPNPEALRLSQFVRVRTADPSVEEGYYHLVIAMTTSLTEAERMVESLDTLKSEARIVELRHQEVRTVYKVALGRFKQPYHTFRLRAWYGFREDQFADAYTERFELP
jgi:hypothetical protein